jgi:hypothetical protein
MTLVSKKITQVKVITMILQNTKEKVLLKLMIILGKNRN